MLINLLNCISTSSSPHQLMQQVSQKSFKLHASGKDALVGCLPLYILYSRAVGNFSERIHSKSVAGHFGIDCLAFNNIVFAALYRSDDASD